MSETRIVVQLSRVVVARRDTLVACLRRWVTGGRSPSPALVRAFELSPDERRFARELLRSHTRLWVFRTHQGKFCGDFVLVDMSARCPTRRRCWVVDVKLGAPLTLGGGGAGRQLVNANRAVASVAATCGAVGPGVIPRKLAGDRRALIQALV